MATKTKATAATEPSKTDEEIGTTTDAPKDPPAEPIPGTEPSDPEVPDTEKSGAQSQARAADEGRDGAGSPAFVPPPDYPRFADKVTLWAIRGAPEYAFALGFVSVDKTQAQSLIESGAAVDPNQIYPLPFIEQTAQEAGQSAKANVTGAAVPPTGVVADGGATSVVTFTVKDGNGVAIKGERVSFTKDQATAALSTTSAVSDVDGLAVVTVTDTAVQTVKVTGTLLNHAKADVDIGFTEAA
jgi:hypothetical protein